ncbi:lysylphosphatidylglycerol synthase transmembrane domain-containing protein [Corynebacterium uterequi]|uniref:Putative integral membrane protein n=1 Tax=Corynebacterium uterequi TaxID=1072256 RepID=A0A0G3HGY4_9CORY|nr:lysylphosphatidylglycerol synthase transmembrane domain-containing protein [Corynebacterium uterequi]AKK12040.1 putative integral membrane protein [Corynebacterium uterequi]
MASARTRQWLRWLAPLAVLGLLLVALRGQLPFLGEAFARLGDTHPGPVLAGVVTAVASLVAMGEVIRLLMRSGSVTVAARETLAITLASNAWSTSVPGGPAISAVLTFQVQRRWGASAAVCGWFFVISSVISTAWLALLGLLAVVVGADLSTGSLLATGAVLIAVGAAVFWACHRPDVLARWLGAAARRTNRWASRRVRRLSGRALIDADAVETSVRQLGLVRISARDFAAVSAFSLANRALDVATIWCAAWAVTGQPRADVGAILLAYLTAKIAGSAQVTPAGLGTVEAAIIAALVATGVPAVDATGTAIVYRLISFAFITAIGWIIYAARYARHGFAGPAALRRA